MADGRWKMEDGKESTSISGYYATGNAHQRANREKPEGKYPIQKGKGRKIRSKSEEEKRDIIIMFTSISRQCLFLISFFISVLGEPTTTADPACCLLDKGSNTRGMRTSIQPLPLPTYSQYRHPANADGSKLLLQ